MKLTILFKFFQNFSFLPYHTTAHTATDKRTGAISTRPFCCKSENQKQPCSIIAVATFLKPAILAPATRL